jgi:hypothetical protein
VPATSPKKFHRLSGPRSNKKKELLPSLFVGYSIKKSRLCLFFYRLVIYIFPRVFVSISFCVCVCRQVCCYCGLFPCHLRSTLTQRLATFKQRANIMRCWKKKKSKKNSAGNVEKIDTQSGGIQSSISR